jgi:DNA-binding response OmpR family regulator
MMPGMDGFQFLAKVKNEEKTARIPVVILSSLTGEEEILKGLKQGASDYITKPFSPLVLIAKIHKNIEPEKCMYL